MNTNISSSITICCSECGQFIVMTAEDAEIKWKFNGGCPGYSVKTHCPHCKKMSVVKQTDEAKKMLAHRIKSI